MTNDPRQDLTLAIKQERDRLLANGSTTKYELREVVEEKHADLIAAWTGSLARQRMLDLCQESLVATVGSKEQLLLPEFGEDRRSYTVREGRIYRYVAVERANLGHVDDDLAVSARNQKAVNSEHRNRVQRRNLLWKAPGAHRGMPVVEALRRLYDTPPDEQITRGDAA
jgi:hypothetical protein